MKEFSKTVEQFWSVSMDAIVATFFEKITPIWKKTNFEKSRERVLQKGIAVNNWTIYQTAFLVSIGGVFGAW